MFDKIRNRLDFRGAVLDLLNYGGRDAFPEDWWGPSCGNLKLHQLRHYIHSGELELTVKGWIFNYDPRRAAIDHVDRVYRAYAYQTGITLVPNDFINIMGCITQGYGTWGVITPYITMADITQYRNVEVAQFWKKEIHNLIEKTAKYRAEQKLRLPQILAARNAARSLLKEDWEDILDDDLLGDFKAREIWEAVSYTPKSEWEVHQSSGISIQEVCKWMLIFYNYGLISSDSSTSDEPTYERSLFPPTDEEKLWIYNAFMEHVD